MSRNSPIYISTRTQDSAKVLMSNRDSNIIPTKIKLKHSIIKKIYAASIEKARFSIQSQKENIDERLETLVSVERNFVQNLIYIRNKKGSVDKLVIPEYQNTPNSKTLKNFKRKKGSSISNLSHTRKISYQRKPEYSACLAGSDTLSRILF